MSITCLVLAYISLLIFSSVIDHYGVTILNGFLVPIGLTIFFVLFSLFEYLLIKARVVHKFIRFLIYLQWILTASGLIGFWLTMTISQGLPPQFFQ